MKFSATTSKGSGIGYRVGVRDMTFIAAVGGAGRAIDINYYNGAGTAAQRSAVIQSINWESDSAIADTHYFNIGVRLSQASDALLLNVKGSQISEPTDEMIHVWIDGPSSHNWFGFTIDHADFQGGGWGIKMTDGCAIEGISVYNLFSVGQKYNVYSNAEGTSNPSSRNQNIVVQGGALNARVKNVRINKWGAVFIQNADLFKGVGSSDVSDSNIDVQFSERIYIQNNKIERVTDSAGYPVILLNAASHIIVSGNNIRSVGTGGGITLAGDTTTHNSGPALIAGNSLMSFSGASNEAFYIVGTDKVNITGNMDIGWSTQFNGTSNVNYTNSVNNVHY
jgi:hypothetical protein